jgi:hypothetical protein
MWGARNVTINSIIFIRSLDWKEISRELQSNLNKKFMRLPLKPKKKVNLISVRAIKYLYWNVRNYLRMQITISIIRNMKRCKNLLKRTTLRSIVALTLTWQVLELSSHQSTRTSNDLLMNIKVV